MIVKVIQNSLKYKTEKMKEERLKKLEWIMKTVVTDLIFKEIDYSSESYWIITVTRIKISSDLSYMDIYVSSLKNSEKLTKDLATYAYNIQKQLVKRMSIRRIPKIRFRYDDSGKISWEIISAIKDLNINNDK